jgi:hypothetical protein
MSAPVEVYDSEIIQIHKILEKLRDRYQKQSRSYTAFEREARERFHEIGLLIDINWHSYAVGDVPQEGAMPEITVTGRADPSFAWDPDQQVHEVVQDILELPGQEKGGWIKADETGTFRQFRDEHGHGHSHTHADGTTHSH